MNFQQLRSVREAVRRGFNLTEVAAALHTSQPGVSRQIRELETELGIELFVRAGKRLTGLTAPGQAVLPIVERLLQDAENLRRAGEEFAGAERGTLVVAATHSQARYALPPAVRDFRATHPQVQLRMHQGSPRQVAALLMSGEADLGIATAVLAEVPELVVLPSYRWTHAVVVPRGHALAEAAARGEPLTLESIARHPVITYEPGYTGRSAIDDAFSAAGLAFDLVLSAMDADVIKTYVELGLGVGIIASIAHDAERDTALVALDARHLFATNVTYVAMRRGAWLRGYVFDFIATFAPPLDRAAVEAAMRQASPPPASLAAPPPASLAAPPLSSRP